MLTMESVGSQDKDAQAQRKNARENILELRNELIFNSSLSTKLVRWNESGECCKWYGVECDASGYVVSLQLDDEAISGGIGQVPTEILSLTRLVSLDISGFDISLEHPNLEMLVQNLTGLRELYLDYVGITSSYERTKWSHIISSYLPNLTALSLFECHLSGPLSSSFLQLHSLSILRLSYNDLSAVAALDLLASFPSLTVLGLSNCRLKGSIPATFANLTKLIHDVDLSFNYLNGSLSPTLFEGFSNLSYLYLERNSFSGNIPHSLFGLPSLRELELSYNQFNGTFRLDNIRNLANLTYFGVSHNILSVDVGNSNSSSYRCVQLKWLSLASCNLSHFPDFIKHLNMEILDLSKNQLAGEIPSWIWGTQLEYLDLSFNRLTDVQKPFHMSASLKHLNLQSNQLTGELHLPVPLASNLSYLLIANNSLTGSIPTSLCNAIHLKVLELSENKLSGGIPPCLLENIIIFQMGQNNISGIIPDTFSMDCKLRYFNLNNNTLEGRIPRSLESCRSLVFMDVGNNNINDTFPCMLSSTVTVLILNSNRFHGEVRCHNSWASLQIVDISSNHFNGSLESLNFSDWSAMTLKGDKQSWFVEFDTSIFGGEFGMTLHMKGMNLELNGIWTDFGSIDFSSNNFQGEIPNVIGNLTSLHHLNLSHNALNGSIPMSFGQLSHLESLDLSANQLTGPIPMDLGELTFLEVLNLSYNKLVGMIPNGRQFQTFTADRFEGNPGLCGFPLHTNCSPTDDNITREHEDVEDKKEIEWEYVSAALGYVVGVGIIVWLLLFCRRFREKYFGKIEEVVEDIFIARDMRRRRARMVARNRARRL
ncbi:hypothetical protein SASPL_136847 [Salvia splendens]|uniref:Leucine-rich repeat-containing N-terminal plant-type domain-containing protein n=1 Tax=Salvia splendens TaxID=180675 RepID=A0A8X8ZGZ9_SALSN|nr:hypothetical protein SASPL_136847 [Salvia splendens]